MNKFHFETVLKLFTEMSEKCNVQRNSIKMKVTYSALFKWIMELQNLGLLGVKKVGRENRIKFTERGRKLAILFKEIDAILNEKGGNGCSGERKNGR
jgi:predicted transcriptional regulator